jgi:hypothetical protein
MKSRMHASDRFPLDDEVIEQICQLVEAGNYITVACAAIGVHRSTFSAWRRKGERVSHHLESTEQEIDPGEYPEHILPADVTPEDWQCYRLFWALETSEAKAEATAVLMVRKQMPEQWTAAMTLLERRFPDRWRKRQTFEQVLIGDEGIDEQAVIEDPEAVRMLHDALARVANGESVDDLVDEPEPVLDSEGIPKLNQPLLNPPPHS